MADTSRRRRRLRIAKNLVRGSFLETFDNVLFYFLACMSVCIYLSLWNIKEGGGLTPFIGSETQSLRHDIEQMDKIIPPNQFFNSWRSKDWYLNGSTFHESVLDDLCILWIFTALIDWRGYYNIMLVFLEFLLHFWLCCIRFLIKKYGYRNLALYLLFFVVFSVLFVFGGSQILHICCQALVRLLDKNIYYETYLKFKFPAKAKFSFRIDHPSTNGTDPPYYLYTFSRYNFKDSECWDTEDGCQTQKDLIESAIYLFVYFENLIFVVFSVILAFLMMLIIDNIIVKFCIIPISQSCLYYGIRRSSFRSVRGPPITRLHPAPTEQEIVDNSESEYSEPEVDEDKFYEFYLSYDDKDPFDLMVAQHLKGLLLSMSYTVFDFMTDVPYGTLMLTEISKAIHRSSRFIIIASKSYTENNDLEFDVIQNTIRNQYTDAKNRLLIVMTKPCEIIGIERVPCIHLSSLMAENETLGDECIREFWKWENLTRPLHSDGRETNVQSEEEGNPAFP